MTTQAEITKSGVALKGGMFTLTTIQLLDYNLDDLPDLLDEKIKQAPNFFSYAPVVLDIQRVKAPTIDFLALVEVFRRKKLVPVGVRGAAKTLRESAILAGLAVFPEEKPAGKKTAPEGASPKEEALSAPILPRAQTISGTPTRLMTQPIRSGQQVYAPGGDLVVLASVGHGAEILADGHIHVHGPLRGRALAGITGNRSVIIYAKSLEAELVSIAGQYLLSEDLKEHYWKQSVCIQLEEGRLNIRAV